MVMKVSKVDVWAATIEDRPGGLAEKLQPLAAAKANLEFVIARRSPERPGRGVVFAAGLKNAAEARTAKKAGFAKTANLHSVRVQGPDKPGLGARMTAALAEAGINLRGLSAAALGKQCVVYLAFDGAAEARRAIRVLQRLP